MSEFSTSSLLEVSVDQRSLREARSTIESELGDVQVDVSTSGAAAASGGRRSGNVRGREQAMHRQLLSSQTQELSDISESWEDNIELNERRNDLLEQLVESNDQGNRVRARSMGGGLALAAGGVAAVAGALSGLPSLLAESLGDLVSGSVPASELISGTVGVGELIDGSVGAGELVGGAVGAGALITGTVAAGGLITGTVAASELITGVGLGTLVDSVAVDALVSGASLTALVSSVSVGSLLTPVNIGTLITGTINLADYVTGPGGSGAPSPDGSPAPTGDTGQPTGDGSPAPTGDDTGAPSGNGTGIPDWMIAGGVAGASIGVAGGLAKLGGAGAGLGMGAGGASASVSTGALAGAGGLAAGAGLLYAEYRGLEALSERYGGGRDPLVGQTVTEGGGVIGTSSTTDIGPTSSELPSVSGGSGLEGGDARLATIAAQQSQGEALNLGDDDDDEEGSADTVVQNNQTINVEPRIEIPRDDRRTEEIVRDEVDELERRLERRFSRQ